MKIFKKMIFISVFALLLSSCSNFILLKGVLMQKLNGWIC